ncbi:DUF4307 domain-containing protein [Salinibacterium sp. SYSU T00001]|uniref:DUF4307 domain-containing protein n=1 Tax=Homoserinimonas sedimenticola TaxID=2986805 RepID=UPI0022358F06|nr:DUF4307 domain-containing protein [Salinibacterium sedimenticola]MCW4386442.1 DUF4307 domain-containing protein [Salinibacterium sedimenticola]
MSSSAALDARYGRTPERRARQRLVAWIAGIGVALTVIAWVVWVALDGTTATIQSRMLGADILDDRAVTMTVEVSAPAGTEVSCALEVQNANHAIVGWKIVELPSSERYTRTFTETVNTVDQGVTGLIYRCWSA